MSSQLFSQIPQQVWSRAGVDHRSSRGIKDGRKKLRFDENIEELELSPDVTSWISETESDASSDGTIECEVRDSIHDEAPTSSLPDSSKLIGSSDSITQTDKIVLVSKETQTEESMLNRPSCGYENCQKVHAMRTMMEFKTPLNTKAPLKVGLGLNGRKRKVFYPDDED